MTHPSGQTIPVTLFADYNCPFCYVATCRLWRLTQRHDLDILWRSLELHPDIPATGRPLTREEAETESGETIREMVKDDALPWQPRTARSNTRRALLLAQAVYLYRREAFVDLHMALYHAVFGEGRNLGDEAVLRSIAAAQGVDDLLGTAWGTSEPVQLFLGHVEAAQELGISSIPALVVSGRVFPGAASMDILEQALQHAAEGAPPA